MKALKLDSTYRPVAIVDAVEALVLCLVGKARAIENYAKKIHSPSRSFNIPAVIVLNRYVRFRYSTISPNRANVLWRDNNQCQYCTKYFKYEHLTMDHVLPKSRGGLNTWENLVTACKKCNQKKGNKTPRESGMAPLHPPRRPKSTLLKALPKGQINESWKEYLWEFK